ncbi:MAG TPA: hypothetical protein PKA58_00230 [Polyangium sp.]|jgi:hypothetical protein|nr:hypothetical protein [Polyangium sp.]
MNNSTTPNDWHFIGKHCMRFEPPDLFITRLIGDVSLEQNLESMRWLDDLEIPTIGFYSLVDVSEVGRQDPRLMKAADSVQSKHRCRAMVYYNARFHQRTLVNIFLRAAKVINHPLAKTPTKIFSTEEEARAWIAADRTKTP